MRRSHLTNGIENGRVCKVSFFPYVGIFDSFYKSDSKKLMIYQSAGDKLNQRNFFSFIRRNF